VTSINYLGGSQVQKNIPLPWAFLIGSSQKKLSFGQSQNGNIVISSFGLLIKVKRRELRAKDMEGSEAPLRTH